MYDKLNKYALWLNQIVFLGHVVSKDGVLIDQSKIEVVVK